MSIDQSELQTIRIPFPIADSLPQIKLEDIASEITTIQLEKSDSTKNEYVNSLQFDDDKIFMLVDSRRLLIFDEDGKFLRTIGPTIDNKLQNFTLYKEKKQVWITNSETTTITKYDYSGKRIEYVEMRHFYPLELAVLPDESLVINADKGDSRRAKEIHNYLFNRVTFGDNITVERGLHLKTDHVQSSDFNLGNSIQEGYNGVSYMPAFHDTLYNVTEKGLEARFAFTIPQDGIKLRDIYKSDPGTIWDGIWDRNNYVQSFADMEDFLVISVNEKQKGNFYLLFDKEAKTLKRVVYKGNERYDLYFHSSDSFAFIMSSHQHGVKVIVAKLDKLVDL